MGVWHKRGVALAVSAAAMAVMVVGCGGGHSPEESAELTAVSIMTSESKTATLEVTPTESIPTTWTPSSGTAQIKDLYTRTPTPEPTTTPRPTTRPTRTPRPSATPPLRPTATRAEGEYIVQAGDTLARLARRFDVTIREIAAANGIENIHFIVVGQRLIIP